ncbi:CsbD family protein [Anaerocolumna sedimenticola]|uniref:CsbD family protein n=2 Tax=Anaerocolumna sedimenticola TaxID=2696063 RepID=A0A6P1TS71_9FIRM|nr:CsbD family protein [Anaerocolumna sedimenticola]
MDKIENGKDKVLGKMKETAGKWMDDEDLEFQGKVQGMKAAIGEKADDMKDAVLGKTNDLLDKVNVVIEDKKKK